MMRIVTWNVNSLRARIDHVARFTREFTPDLLCLQETKVKDDSFPLGAVQDLGYPYVLYAGIPSYNGVAVLSKVPIIERDMPRFGQNDGRHLSVFLPDYHLRVENLYVPAGGDIPDTDTNPKFAYKLDFMAKLTAQFAEEQPQRTIVLGDINIAPGEYDVFSHKQMLRVVSHTPPELEAFAALMASNNWHNSLRADIPEPIRIYSWWSYRVREWSPESRGLLLDHLLLSPDLISSQHQAFLAQETRGWQPKPSDHAPLIVDLDL